MHRVWVARQRLEDQLAQTALEQMLVHLDGLDRQLDALDCDLEEIARGFFFSIGARELRPAIDRECGGSSSP